MSGESFWREMGREIQTDFFGLTFDIGVIISVSEDSNFCRVKISKSENEKLAYITHPMSGGASPKDAKPFKAWGIFAPPTEGSICIVMTTMGQVYLVATLPPLNLTTDNGFERWRSDQKLNINRLPIKDSNKRKDPATKSNENLLKKGEIFNRSIGMADMLLDYIGNVLFDSSKQFTVRIGDRDANNKITKPEVELSVGRIVDSKGEEELQNGVKVKAKLDVKGSDGKSKVLINVCADGQINLFQSSGAVIAVSGSGEIDIEAAENRDTTIAGDVVYVSGNQVNLGKTPLGFAVFADTPGLDFVSKEGVPLHSSKKINMG